MKWLGVAVVIALALSATSWTTAQAPVTAIRAGRLIDPDAGTSATNQVILIEGSQIKAVGARRGDSGGRDGDRSVHVDGHARRLRRAHASVHDREARRATPTNYFYTTLRDPDSMRAVEGVANARAMLEAGFTTVRDVGNEGNYACVSVRRGIQSGLVPGPTMITAGRIIAPFGGQFHLQPDKPTLGDPEYFFADTRDEMRKAIRENIHYGATVIKIVVDDQRYIYSVDDIRFMKDEVAAAGLKLAAHAWTAAGAHNAADAGVDSIEHGNALIDADLALMKKNGVVLVGTEYLGVHGDARRCGSIG